MQCPNCCADKPYADRCPAAQISADQQHRNRTTHIRDLLETEVYYRMNVLAILRELPADDLAAIERFVNRCYDWRQAH